MEAQHRSRPSRPLLLLLGLGLACACSSTGGAGQAPAGPDVVARTVPYEHDGTEFEGYLAYDAAIEGPRPAVLVVHEWWGHNDYARRRARMLAEMGYLAFALDMYGSGKQAEHPEDAQAFAGEVMANKDVAVARFEAARKLLLAQPWSDGERVAAIGYCFGGGVVLHMARVGAELDGVASFHGSLGTDRPARAGEAQARILVLHGADDPFVPASDVEALKAEMEAAGADLTFVAYEGVKHSFTNPDATAVGERFGLPLVYDEQADRESWAELDRFLTEVFGQ